MTNKPTEILLVEDDDNLRLTLADNLEFQGYVVHCAATLAAANQLIKVENGIRLTILDIMLPDGSGYDFCKRLRTQQWTHPILMLTARTLEDDLVTGFQAGADDYLAKPYRLRELLVRVEALLRRSISSETTKAASGIPGFDLQRDARLVISGDGQRIDLTPKEFDLLLFLVDRPNQALSRDAILDAVWGQQVVVDPRTVDNFVSNLKRKMNEPSGAVFSVATVRGVGYRYEC